MIRPVFRIVVFTALLMLVVDMASGQLISPGKLSQVHSELEGMTNCTQCHTLGERGITPNLCLDCHRPLRSRLEADEGYHATVSDQNCADCHKEHFGTDFQIVRFDTTAFEHEESTTFALLGAHTDVSCRSCHVPEYIQSQEVLAFKGEHEALGRTYLGLAAVCMTCHNTESPHEEQFGDEDCLACHTEEEWDTVPNFNHDDTTYPLTGQHVEVACLDCHAPEPRPDADPFIPYVGINASTCASCHEDAHAGAMGPTCSSCHVTDGWRNVNRAALETDFDHATTSFPLLGAHEEVTCETCHNQIPFGNETIQLAYVPGTEAFAFPHPLSENCLSCHVDYHEEVFAGHVRGPTCDNCHTEDGWYPTTYDLERHNTEAAFELTGAHLATPCFACHNNADLGHSALTFTFETTTCQSCHEQDNPHGEQFAEDQGETVCESCHTTTTWVFDTATFDHDQTGFPLEGAHTSVVCADCHEPETTTDGGDVLLFRGLSTACADCHGSDDPHDGQFAGQACTDCHDTAAFTIASFDHGTTAFLLEGAHETLACVACHTEEQAADGTLFTRFKPLGTACIDCHDDE